MNSFSAPQVSREMLSRALERVEVSGIDQDVHPIDHARKKPSQLHIQLPSVHRIPCELISIMIRMRLNFFHWLARTRETSFEQAFIFRMRQ